MTSVYLLNRNNGIPRGPMSWSEAQAQISAMPKGDWVALAPIHDDPDRHPFAGECYCHDPKPWGTCLHCNRARGWIQHEILCLVNEIADMAQEHDPDAWFDSWQWRRSEHEDGDTCPECKVGDLYCGSCERDTECETCDGKGWTGDVDQGTEAICEDCCGDGNHTCDYTYETGIEAEPMQWFIVSDYLKDRLAQQGELVSDYRGMALWGRQCWGQSIELDRTLQRISQTLGGGQG